MDFIVNGRHVQPDPAPSHTTLLDWLRSTGFTGSKEGCAEGECGACTVLLVADGPHGAELRPVNSCLLLLNTLQGQEVYTIESLARDGQLHEAQIAMAAGGGSQCGYCTPGFVMSMVAEQYRPGRTTPCDPHALSGNLCRCTGYRPIRDAALSLGPPPDDELRRRLAHPAPVLRAFYEGGFHRPATLAEALELLSKHPAAHIIAGGTDLVVESNLKGRRFETLIAAEAIPELRVFRDAPDAMEIGAGLALSEIEALWPHAPAVIRDWFPLFASPLIRNRATLGGNLATASPIGDAAPLLLALDASVNINGTRRIPLSDFFLGYRQTALAPGELLVSISIPKPFPQRAAFFKVAKRRTDDISTVAAAFALDRDDQGIITRARVAYGGVAATPLRAHAVEAALEGNPWTSDTLHCAQAAAAASLHPIGDHRGSAAYRLALTQTLLAKFLRMAA